MTEQQERVERFSEELREGPPVSDRSIKEILDALRPQMQELVNKQVELAKTELTPVGRRLGIAVALLASGAVFMFLLVVFLFLAVMFALDLALDSPSVPTFLWAAALITSGILLVIGGGLAGAGAGILRNLDPKPRRTITTLQQNIEWLKGQFRS